jgi:hypothetical protein
MDMIIDCGRCTVRDVACENCAVTFVTSAEPRPESAPVPPRKSRGTTTTTGKPTSAASREPVIELDAAEIRALTALANAGLIPPLRYAPSMAKAS